jgi:hypothetical protein
MSIQQVGVYLKAKPRPDIHEAEAWTNTTRSVNHPSKVVGEVGSGSKDGICRGIGPGPSKPTSQMDLMRHPSG